MHDGREVRPKAGGLGQVACAEIWAAETWVSRIKCNLLQPDLCLPSPVGSGVYCIPLPTCPLQPELRAGRLLVSLRLGLRSRTWFLGPQVLSTRSPSWDCAAGRQSCLSRGSTKQLSWVDCFSLHTPHPCLQASVACEQRDEVETALVLVRLLCPWHLTGVV